MADHDGFSLDMRRIEDFEFRVSFDDPGLPELTVDEPEPIGRGGGPNAARLVGAAVGNCLSASLLFCLKKSRVEVGGLETRVRGQLWRNERGRMRIGRIDVEITLDAADGDMSRVERCLGLFEDYCVVTASVRRGIDVGVTVFDRQGNRLMPAQAALVE